MIANSRSRFNEGEWNRVRFARFGEGEWNRVRRIEEFVPHPITVWAASARI